MASAIHHGPPGSFKSFTLVQRFAIDALRSGRVVITNVRGLTSIDRIQEQFPEETFPDSADLVFVNTDSCDMRPIMARWFHWVPFGAMVIIDEGQRIYPKRRDFKLEALDQRMVLPGFDVQDLAIEVHDEYLNKTYTVSRPDNIADAFDMQRHFNWDIYISTPHIDKIIDPIREVCQAAYRHTSLSEKLGGVPIIGHFFKDSWYEFRHDPDNSGKAVSHISGKPRKYKADPRIYACYQSTATGEHTPSKADQSIFGDPKLKMLLLFIVLAIGAFFVLLAGKLSSGKASVALSSPAAPVGSGTNKSLFRPIPEPAGVHAVSSGLDAAGHGVVQQAAVFFDRLGYRLLQVSYQSTQDANQRMLAFVADSVDGLKTVTFSELFDAGVRVSIYGLCRVTLISQDGAVLNLGCNSSQLSACGVRVDTPDYVIRRGCRKYSDPKPARQPLAIPENALVATASRFAGYSSK